MATPVAFGADASDLARSSSPHLLAPPAPPLIERREGFGAEAGAGPGPVRQSTGTLYSIGEPTDEEQLYVELLNRSRANPPVEGRRLAGLTEPNVVSAYRQFGVDLALLVKQFDAIAAAPPVSINPKLTTAARRHSQDMFDNEFQGHDGTDGSTAPQRATAAGYIWNTIAENVYASAENVEYGHAGFDVDWGFGPGGVQNPPGHRRTIHLAELREVGVGVVLGLKGEVGPQLVTQDFGSRAGLTPFITGVAYYDFNGNGFYDLGEGLGGVTVRVSNTASYAVTARSGGYSVPVAGNGAYTVTFEVPGLSPVDQGVTVAGGANLKVDHRPTYSPPVLGGSSVAYVGRNNDYVFASVGGATGYDWRTMARLPWVTPEGAEAGLGRFAAQISAGYEPVAQGVQAQGGASFHLVHPALENQVLSLVNPLRLGANSQLTFQSRLGWATDIQVARVQLSTDSGTTWTDLWTKAGSGGAGQSAFARETVSLAGYAGQLVQLRFAYTITAGSYYAQKDNGVGWHLDEILVDDAEELVAGEAQKVTDANRVRYRPTTVGSFLLQVRASIGDRLLPWGPGLSVTTQDGGALPPEIVVSTPVRAAGGAWEIPFRLDAGSADTFEVHASSTVTGPWSRLAGVTVRSTGAGAYRATLPVDNSALRFLRIAVP